MKKEKKLSGRCLACEWTEANFVALRSDGERFLRCSRCQSVYLEKIPLRATDLYDENYFALDLCSAESNQEDRVGYEVSYESKYSNSEFYWAFRLCDYLLNKTIEGEQVKRCLDVGAATGRLLNVFKEADYQTYGIEFSDPARNVAASHGHTMTNQAIESLQIDHAGFNVVTALEVIEHVENLQEFFSGICKVMAEDGIFLGYFPSSYDEYFGVTNSYHWLHISFEHLIYPTEMGIREAMRASFGKNIFTTTFLTMQGEDVIPNTLVIAFKKNIAKTGKVEVAELFRQLNYLNDPNFFHFSTTHAGLGEVWKELLRNQTVVTCTDVPFLVGVLCSKFGLAEIPNFVMECNVEVDLLSDSKVLDLLAMAMHRGRVHFIKDILTKITSRKLPPGLIKEYYKLVADFEKNENVNEAAMIQDFGGGGSEKVIDEISLMSARYDAVSTGRDAALVERDAALAERDAALMERDAALAKRDAALMERDAALAERDAVKAERDSTKEELYLVYRSISWKITWLLRMFTSKIGLFVKKLKILFSVVLPALTWTRLVKGIKLLIMGDLNALKFSIKYIAKENKKTNYQKRETEEIAPSALMPDQPLVTVVIPCFNYGEYVVSAIESVLCQTLKNIEVIVVDGGSTDGTTTETLRTLQRPRTKIVLREGRHLVGDNRNFGIALANGRYICCLDADDTLDPTYLEKAVFHLETYAYDIVSTSINFVGFNEGHIDTLEYPDLNDMTNGNHVLTCAVFRKQLWESSGGYFDVGVGKQHVAEDWDFWLRLSAKGARIRNISKEYLFNYRIHKGGSLSSGADVKSLADQKKMILKRNKNLLSAEAYKNSKQQKSRYLRCNPQKSALAISYAEQITSSKKLMLLTIPFSVVGGAERLLSGLCRYLSNNDWRIIVVTTLENEISSGSTIHWFKEITPEVYELVKFLVPEEHEDFVKYLITSRKPDCILNAGSRLTYEMLPDLKEENKDLCVIDLLFNTEGHVKSHIEYRKFITTAFAENQEVYDWLIHKAGWADSQIKKISSGIDLFQFQPRDRPDFLVDKYNINKNELVVGFSGRLSEEKGPDIFVEIAKLCQGTPNLRFMMTGAGSMSEILKKQVELLPASVKFEFEGLVEDVEPYLALYDVLILPSRFDGRPLVVMEALGCGVPVIASNVGALPDLIENGRNGYLVPIGDASAFAARIQEFTRDSSLLSQLKYKARIFAENELDTKKAYYDYNLKLHQIIEINASVNAKNL